MHGDSDWTVHSGVIPVDAGGPHQVPDWTPSHPNQQSRAGPVWCDELALVD